MCIFHSLNNEHQNIVKEIFDIPLNSITPWSTILWSRILSLLEAVAEARGGAVQLEDGTVCVMIPHHQENRTGVFPYQGNYYASFPTVKAIRDFLATVEIQPDE
jgi:hypothetical protein